MSRDASGNWIPLAPVVGGTVITSTWANNMMTSFGADITESLDRSGRGGMLVPFRIADGTKAEPGYSWTAELSTGFYRDLGGSDMRVSISNTDIFRWNDSGAQISYDDGVTWQNVVTSGGIGDQVPVDVGTVADNTLRWSGTVWAETSTLTTSATTVTVNGTLLSPGAGANSFRAGLNAGSTTQGASSVAVGPSAGQTTQGTNAVAVGKSAGTTSQSNNSVAMGNLAGNDTQGASSVAVGTQAAQTTQGSNSVAVGNSAGKTTQGNNSVAVGKQAGETNQGSNGIIINASGVALDDTTAGHIHIASDDGSLDFLTASGWAMSDDLKVTGVSEASDNLISARLDNPGNSSVLGRVGFGGLDFDGSQYIGARVIGKTSQAWDGTGEGGTKLEFEVTQNGTQTRTVAMTLDYGTGLTLTNGQVLADPADTSTAPAYSFEGDPDTGMYSGGADTIRFATAGVEAMQIDSAGNVGIGITNPNVALVVDGKARVTESFLCASSDSAAAPGYSWNSDEDTGMYRRGADSIGWTIGGVPAMYISASNTVNVLSTGNDDRVAGTNSEAGASTIHRFITLTQLEYEGLTPDANTLYIIT